MIQTTGVKSTMLQVQAVEIGETFVYVRSNITAIKENAGLENEFVGWQYDEVQYEKDEYIRHLSEISATNEATIDTLLTEIIPSMMGV